MIDLPKGVWRWLSENARDLGRMAAAAETIARELARIRATMEDEQKERE